MHVAVARMEDVDAAQVVSLLHGLDARQQRTDTAARHGAVHAVVVGRNAPGCRERVFAPRPEAQTFVLRAGNLNARSAVFAQDRGHAHDFVGDFFGCAVRFAQQDRRRVEIVTRVDEFLDGAGGRLVHHFQTRRDDARRDDAGHRVAAFHHVVETRHDDLCGLRLGDQLDGHFGDDRKHAFAADQHGQQIQTGRIGRERAEFDDFALHGDGAHAQHVVHRQTVFEAVNAAGILRDVATDRAGNLRRRVRRVIQAVRRGGLGDGQIAHAGLDRGGSRVRIDFHDLTETRE